MKIRIETDLEWYPMNKIVDDIYGLECDVTEETVKRWQRIEKEFSEMQKEMNAVIESAIKGRMA